MEFHVEDHPDPRDIDVLETQIRHEASAATGLGVPLFVTTRSQTGATVVVVVVLLFAARGSVVVAETEEFAVIVPAAIEGAITDVRRVH